MGAGNRLGPCVTSPTPSGNGLHARLRGSWGPGGTQVTPRKDVLSWPAYTSTSLAVCTVDVLGLIPSPTPGLFYLANPCISFKT